MMNYLSNTIYQHDPNTVSRLIGGEMIVVPIRNNLGDMENIYTMNDTAARIWELIDGKRHLGEIYQQILDEYAIEPKEAEHDLEQLIGELLEEGMLVEKQA